MIAIRLNAEVEQRLERLALRTGRTKTACARQAIVEHLEDQDDLRLVERRLKKPGKTYSLDEARSALGLPD